MNTEVTSAEQSGHPSWLVVPAGALLWCTAAGPNVWDAGELVAAAASLGGSHAPGQPLYSLLGHAATLLPFGPMPFRVALLSGAGQVLAAWMLWALTRRALASLEAPDTWVVRFAPHGAALALLLAAPVAKSSTRVEVYGLALALTIAAVSELIAWAEGRASGLRRGALLAGLAVAVHPPHGLVALLVGASVLVVHRRAALPRLRALPWAALFCLLGLATYALLPARAHAGAPMWGEPTTGAGFLAYISASAYRQNIEAGGSWLGNVADVFGYTVLAAGAVPLLGAVALAARGRHLAAGPRRLVWVLLLSVPTASLAACLQPLETANADNIAYTAPAVALLVLAGTLGFALAARGPGRAFAAGAVLLLAVNPSGAASAHRALDVGAPALETLAGTFLDTPGPRAFVLLDQDFAAASWLMAREVDGARPDAAVFVTGLATSSWHWRAMVEHPAFDGVPVRGVGASAREAYVDGALQVGLRAVEVASEADWPVGGRGTLSGPYVLLSAAQAGRPVAEESSGERLQDELARGLAMTAPVDAAAVLRRGAIRRARRLIGRELLRPARVGLRRALPFLPHAQRALVTRGPTTAMTRPAPVVRDPNAMLPTREDTVREAAVLMVATGDPVGAFALLEHQAQRGDSRALLQLAWLELSGGRIAQARSALEAFAAAAPELGSEADSLRATLERPGREGGRGAPQ